jgi:hypothetical protein
MTREREAAGYVMPALNPVRAENLNPTASIIVNGRKGLGR